MVAGVLVGAQRHGATIVDVGRGGLFVQTDAPVWPAALVRVRFALVVHQRHVAHQLRGLVRAGVGLRWVRAKASD